MKIAGFFHPKLREIAYFLLAAVLYGAMVNQPAQAAVTLVRFEIMSVTTSAVSLEWETATEYNNLGFYVTRSLTETGTFSRITEFIFAEGSAVSGFTYQHSDVDIQTGQTYFYKLEAVDINYVSEFFGPLLVTPGGVTATASPSVTLTRTNTSTITGTIIASVTITPTPTITLTETSTPTATETSRFRFSTNTRTFTATVTLPVTETPISSLTPRPEASLTATELVIKTSTIPVTETPQIVPTTTPAAGPLSPVALIGFGFLGVMLVGGAVLAGWIWYQRRSGEEI